MSDDCEENEEYRKKSAKKGVSDQMATGETT
jgi:hypothetical protein